MTPTGAERALARLTTSPPSMSEKPHRTCDAYCSATDTAAPDPVPLSAGKENGIHSSSLPSAARGERARPQRAGLLPTAGPQRPPRPGPFPPRLTRAQAPPRPAGRRACAERRGLSPRRRRVSCWAALAAGPRRWGQRAGVGPPRG